MPRSFLVATFSDAETLLHAVRAVTQDDFRIYDVYAPYPIHGLDAAMGARRTRLPWVTFVVGCCALMLALTFPVLHHRARLAAQRRRQTGQFHAGFCAHLL